MCGARFSIKSKLAVIGAINQMKNLLLDMYVCMVSLTVRLRIKIDRICGHLVAMDFACVATNFFSLLLCSVFILLDSDRLINLGRSNVVGQFDYGHTCVACIGH